MSDGTKQVLKAGAAALAFVYIAQRFPRWGRPLLGIVLLLMLYTGIKRGFIPTPNNG